VVENKVEKIQLEDHRKSKTMTIITLGTTGAAVIIWAITSVELGGIPIRQ
jgi:hypothetical protein